MRWVIGILVVVVLVIIGYQYFGDRGVDVAEQPGVTEQPEPGVAEQPPVTEEPEPDVAEQPPVTEEPEPDVAEQPGVTEEPEPDVAEQPGVTEEPEPDVAEQPGVTEEPEPDVAEQPPVTEEPEADVAAPADEPTEPAVGAAQEELTETQIAALTVGDVNVGEQVTGAVQNVEEALQGITDAQSAEAAVPQLNAVNTRLEELSSTVDQLPDDGKKVLADVLNERVAELKTLAADVTAQEGVGDVVNPALEPIIAKLEDWSQQPA